MNKNRVVLQPSYMKLFNCIGSACEDSCCIGWRVTLDKKTYQKYKNSNDVELKKDFEKRVTRIHTNGNDISYGKIKMLPNGRCPFLNDKDLCKIYINLGEEALSNTCTYYPRIVNQIDGGYERSARLSCPEIARAVLLSPDGIKFEQVEESVENSIVVAKKLETEGHLFLHKPQRYFWEIRMFSLSLLQNRMYTLGERLILLGLVYKKIDKLREVRKLKEVTRLLDSMARLISSGEIREELEQVPTNREIQMRFIKEMTDAKFTEGMTSKRYLECFKEMLNGISFRDGQTYDQVLKLYEENSEKFVVPYFAEKEYMIENYLVNTFFIDMMPFGRYKTMWDAYMFLCILYGMIRLHLIGMAGCRQKLDDDMVVKLIQSLSRVVLHNQNYILRMVDLLKESGADSLAFMSILVKE